MTQVYVAGKWIELAEGESITVTGDGKGNLSEVSTPPALTPASVAAMSNNALDALLYGLLGGFPSTHCPVCGWPLEGDARQGCVIGNCSMRPAPARADTPPHYSTNPAAAAEAVAAVMAQGWYPTIYANNKQWWVRLQRARSEKEVREPNQWSDRINIITVYAATECRAKAECAALALAAMKEQK